MPFQASTRSLGPSAVAHDISRTWPQSTRDLCRSDVKAHEFRPFPEIFSKLLDAALSDKQIDSTLLISEDRILNFEHPLEERENRKQLRASLGSALRWMCDTPRDDWLALVPRYGSLAICELLRADDPPKVEDPLLDLYAGSWPFFDGGCVLVPEEVSAPSHSFSKPVRFVSRPDLPSRSAIVVYRLSTHPDFDLFKSAESISKMTCWKLGGVPCPLQIDYSSKKVFAGMPFSGTFKDIWEYGIRRATDEQGLEAYRADEELSNVDVMCKVCQNMQESEFAVIDVTGMRPNVMFELGLLYGRGKKTILIARKGEELPTDLSGLEVIRYENSDDVHRGLSELFASRKR